MTTGTFYEATNDGFGGIYLNYCAGARYEKKGYRGISHLAEHIKCKKERLFSRVLNILCLETNAITDNQQVTFFCTGLDENVGKFADIYLSLFDYIPTKEDFENEKMIVLQEIQSALNDYTLLVAYERGMLNFGGAIGFVEDIKEITYPEFLKFYKEMLGLPSSIVFIGGKEVKKAFERNKNTPTRKAGRKLINYGLNQKPDTSLYQAWSAKSTMSAILFAETEEKYRPTCTFLAYILSDGLYSPLYRVIREDKNLVYYLQFGVSNYGKKNVFEFLTETSKIDEVTETFFEILGNFEKYVSKQDYEDYLKKTQTLIKQFYMKKRSLQYVSYTYVSKDGIFKAFNPNKKEFSYETLKKLCKKLSKRENWKSMRHVGKSIQFIDKV